MQPNITKSALSNFHIIGLLLSVKFILSAQKYEVSAGFALVISIYIIFFLYRMSIQYRETECNGKINYWQAFKYIFLIYFFGSIVSSIVMFIYTSFIDTHFLGQLPDITLKMYEQLKYPVDDKMMKVFESICKPGPYSTLNVVLSIIGGAFWSLILAGIVKKEKNILED